MTLSHIFFAAILLSCIKPILSLRKLVLLLQHRVSLQPPPLLKDFICKSTLIALTPCLSFPWDSLVCIFFRSISATDFLTAELSSNQLSIPVLSRCPETSLVVHSHS